MSKKTFKLALPFLALLIAGMIACAIPSLHPEVSQSEKRKLAEFPKLSVSAVISGDYFDDLTVWFSDTFPGRERWIALSNRVQSLHGYGELSFTGVMPQNDEIPMDEPVKLDLEAPPEETIPETIPDEEEALEEITMHSDSLVVYEGNAFYAVGFSKAYSDEYIRSVSALANRMQSKGVRVISVPALTAASILMPEAYEEQLGVPNQGKTLEYLHSNMSDAVITADVYSALKAHKKEYLFFHGDHHWTATGAYYAYRAACEAAGLTPVDLDSLEILDQGEFQGTTYAKAGQRSAVDKDNVISYLMPGVEMEIVFGEQSFHGTMIRDYREQPLNQKYLAFLESDQALVRLTNDAIQDDSCCVILKDSFGNCFVPFFTRNYHTVYAIDYRKYNQYRLSGFAEHYGVQDIFIAPNLMSIQSSAGASLVKFFCR